MLSKSKNPPSLSIFRNENHSKKFLIGNYAEVIKEIPSIKSESDFYRSVGCFFGLGEIKKAEILLNNFSAYITVTNPIKDIHIQFLKLRILFYKGFREKGFDLAFRLLEDIEKISDNEIINNQALIISKEKLKGLILNLIGENKISTFQLSDALIYLLKAKNIFRQNKDYLMAEAWTRHQLGKLYIIENNFIKANKEINKSLEIRLRIGNNHHIALSLNSLGVIEYKKGNLESAHNYFTKALQYGSSFTGNNYILSLIYNNIAEVQIKSGNLTCARENLMLALNYGKYNKNQQIYMKNIKEEIMKNLKIINETLSEINQKYNKLEKLQNNLNGTTNPRDIDREKQFQKIKSLLEKEPHGIYQKNLPNLTNLSKATISRRVNELIEFGIINAETAGKTRILKINI